MRASTLAIGIVLHLFTEKAGAFGVVKPRSAICRDGCSATTTTASALYFFRRNKEESAETTSENDKTSEESKDKEKEKLGLGSVLPWFAKRAEEPAVVATKEASNNDTTETSETPTTTAATTIAPVATEVKEKPLSIEEQAAKLRAEAERTRLEAERMDAELTLQKIARLEKELAHQQALVSDENHQERKQQSKERLEELQREMEALQNKILGKSAVGTAAKSTTTASASTSTGASSTTRPLPVAGTFDGELSKIVEDFSEEKFQKTLEYIQDAPPLIQKTMAMDVELDFDKVEDINATELALRMDQMSRLDFSYSRRPAPRFTTQEIEQRAEELSSRASQWTLDTRIKKSAGDNTTKLALLSLEYDYYTEEPQWATIEAVDKLVEGEEWLQPVLDALNKSAVDGTIETLFPQCTRKEETSPPPTLAQVQQLMSTVLPKAGFQCQGKPEAVTGGFILRGVSKAKNGDALIDAIDKELEKTSLGEKMTVLYINDFTIFSDEEMMDSPFFDPSEAEPILYIVGPDICREPRPFLLSVVSGLGLATCWYLSIYPFLLNPTISQRVDEQLALAESNMTPDLSWLTDLAVPLFATFVGLQLAHELGHLAVAGINKIKTSVPIFVPSIITGVTSTVTTFRSPPKNKQVMLDFAIAGPLIGMLTSAVAIVIGSQLTLTADPSYLPALPLEILRQSTLGGGIINVILGENVLGVPEGALGSQAVAGMTIPLHPVAIAGYISLVVNALNLLPIGTTDGGRIALALFGRGAKLLVGNAFLFALLAAGLFGSDLFLFYFSFCIAFQTGNEIPSRNEVDAVDFARVVLSTATYIAAALAIIPFQ